MATMKLTPRAAMRARDVSRPRAEHLAEAEAAEPDSAGARATSGGAGNQARGEETTKTPRAPAAAGDERAGRPRFPRRRRGRTPR